MNSRQVGIFALLLATSAASALAQGQTQAQQTKAQQTPARKPQRQQTLLPAQGRDCVVSSQIAYAGCDLRPVKLSGFQVRDAETVDYQHARGFATFTCKNGLMTIERGDAVNLQGCLGRGGRIGQGELEVITDPSDYRYNPGRNNPIPRP